MSQSSQPSFDWQFDVTKQSSSPRSKPSKKKLQRRQQAMGRAIEALESRRLLSVTGFSTAVNYNAGAAPRAVASGDFSGNGKTDLVVVDQTANDVSILMNNGNGTFASPVNYAAGTAPRAVVVGDFNGDGKLDLAVADQTGNTVAILMGNGNGTFQSPVYYSAGSSPVALVAGDFNGDGKLDLAVADFGGGVDVLTGKGDGTFNAAQSFTAGTSPDGIVAADFNHDGNLDLAVSNGGGNVSILDGNGNATFATAVNYAAGATPKALATGDFNGDGYADLAVVNGTAGTVSILTNNGSGAFSAPSPFNVGTSPVAITAADFNNDGKTDLAVVNSGGNNISILDGNGNGTFAAVVNKSVGNNPQGIDADDFNGDGSIDLAVANETDNDVSVLLDKHITVTGDAQSTTEGQALSGVTVATFTDSESGTATTDYTATINWGDGNSTAGAISESNGTFSVAGTHTYTNWGVYNVTVTVQDTLGTTAQATTTATINDAPISASGENLNATAGAEWSGTVATFSNGDATASLADFTVAIDWGDGSSSNGTVVSDGGGNFHVTASHVWQQYGTPTVYVDVQDEGGAEDIATTNVTVADATINPSATSPVFTEGSSSEQAVATFTDDNSFATTGQFSATIDWGDTTSSAGTIEAEDGFYVVLGTHTYAHAGDHTVGVTINSTGGSSANVSSTATVDNAALSASGHPVTVIEGDATGSVVVASFTDANAAAVAGDFTASINWGDGSSADSGTIAWNNGTDKFDVTAPTHTYAHAGDKTITVTITGAGGGTVQATPTATVNNAAMSATAQSISATEGTTTGSVLLATFTDANASATAGDFTASVNWGDGDSNDTATSIVYNSNNQDFEVRGSHLYQHAGSETYTVTVTGAGGGTASDSNTFTVSNATITATAAPVEVTEGSAMVDGFVGSFTSANTYAVAGDFTATIDWGDGSPTSSGTITYNSNTQAFDVTGTHTYDPYGTHTLTLTIDGFGGGSSSDTSNVTVNDAAIHSSGSDITATEGTSTGSVLIATFTDDDASVIAGDFSASVDWGDGSGADSNTNIVDNNGTFEAYGTHTYDHAGDHTIQTSISDPGGSSSLAVATATVDNAEVDATPGSISATEGQSATGVVASFTDANAAAIAGDFTASINWGDGNTSAGNIAWNNNTQAFDVTSSNTYDHAGDHTVTITIDGAYGEVASTDFTTLVANATITVTANSIVGAKEGLAIDPFTVATFTDANAAASEGDFTASVNWGDGTNPTSADIVADGDQFDVIAGHTYAHAGPFTMTVTVDGLGGGSGSDNTTSTIGNQTLTATGHNVSATEGEATGSVLVASFTDANASASAGDFTATIDWGDGSSTDSGTIAWNNVTDKFDVTAPTHTYLHAGTDNLTVTINGAGGGTTQATPDASVANQVITVTATPVSATEGEDTGSVIVANFTDANASASAGDFTASINWGDNTGTDDNTTIVSDGNGGFNVLGDHTFDHAGSPTVSVEVDGMGGGTASDSAAATVANQTITATAGSLNATEGTAFSSKLIGTFTDANSLASAGDFTVTIDWGDGTALDSSTGMITADNGAFDVAGNHTYAHAGSYNVTFTVTGAGGGSDDAVSTANVANAAMAATGHNVSATEGIATGSVLVASFTDANSLASAGDFTATVDWGDGSSTDSGTIAWNNVTDKFDVTAPTHTYLHAGTDNLTVTINGAGGGTAQATPDASVANQVISVTATPVSATEGEDTGSVIVANFTDANAAAVAGDFTASINWGDGTGTDDNTTIVSDGNGGFNVLGDHTFDHAGSPTVSIEVDGMGGGTASDSAAATVANQTITATAGSLNATEGTAFSSNLIGTFTDANSLASAGDFTVTINWGDGTALDSSTGVISADNGAFDVAGNHTYAHAGSYNVTFTVTGAGGGSDDAVSIANVANAAMAASGHDLATTEGVATGSVVVASFTDANSLASAGDFTATIDWGDGSSTDSGTIAWNSNTQKFDVTAPTHTYLHAGSDDLTVTIDGNGGGSAIATPTATVNNAAMSATAQTISAIEGSATGSVLVATFTDANAAAVAGDFTASVDWGDGVSDDTATSIVYNSNNQDFEVYGNHTYYDAGPYTYTVTVTGAGGGTASDSKTITVANAAMNSTGVTFDGVEGSTAYGTVADFTDANLDAYGGDFTATIDWGDGSTSAGEIVDENLGEFSVFGSHTYTLYNNDAITVTIDGLGGGQTIADSTADITDAGLNSTSKIITAVEGASTGSVLVAHFTDGNPDGLIGSYTATIDWGDGSSTSTGTIVSDGNGGYNVYGTHTYSTAAYYDMSVLIGDGGTSTTTADSVAEVSHGVINATAVNISGTEGTAIAGSTVVANFTDTNLSAIASGFSATINWGDGNSSSGTIVSDGNGGFNVEGGHTYLHAGSDNMTVSISGYSGSAQATPTATIGNAALSSTAKPINSVEGATFSGVVGSFGDANASASASDFTATIDWGDGTSTSAGTIAFNAGTGKFDVSGTHVYATPGNYTTTLSILGAGGGTTSAQGLADAEDGTINPSAVTIHATEGASFSGTVASFTDQDVSAPIGNYSATINWGDGSSTESGTLVSLGSGSFDITGTHTWASPGNRSVSVTINDTYGSSATISSSAIVGTANLSATGVNISTTEGTALTNVEVATFTDANPLTTASEFSATITWGDGSSSAGTVVADQSGGFDVLGTHTYNHAGSKTMSIAVTYSGGANTSAGATATVANATLGITPGTVSGIEGQSIVSNVASFTDANANASATDFTATIDWGDGTTSVGAINSNDNGGFDVLGAHTYHHAGAPTVTITITGNGGGTVSTQITAAIANATLTPTGETITATEGNDSGSVLVAHFTDANALASAGDFAATINWGDNTSSAGTIALANGGGFNVTGDHTFLHAGNQPFTVTITGNGGGSTIADSTADVANATLNSTGKTLSATEGTALTSAVVANFTDANAGAVAGDFTASINWGDGTTTSGSVVSDGDGGFNVTGTHTYLHAGSPSATITITGAGGGTTSADTTVNVANATLTPTNKTVTTTEGTSFTAVVAHFSDANSAAAAADFAASINWGDGTTTTGTITAANGGGFDITGTHAYAHAGDQTATTTITGNGGGSADATASITVNNATLTPTGETITATEGTDSGSVLVAHFTDANALASAGDFAATINWGDNTTSAGTITIANGGGFNVTGDHTFLHAGNQPFTVTITGNGGGSITADSTADVANAALNSTGKTLSATEGTALTGAVVANFTDANVAAVAGDFTASINWGDGTTTSGSIVSDGNGGFNVIGTHTYLHAGSPSATITITGAGGGTTSADTTVNVANATLTPTNKTATATEGSSFTAVVAHFSDANSAAAAADFAASINWGDGTTTSGVITAANGGGFDVTGTHTYAHAGNETATITITGNGGGSADATASITVNNATLTFGSKTVSATEGSSFSGAVASFTDANSLASTGDFGAVINWGDGTNSGGTITVDHNGVFYVSGSHTYALLGTRQIAVTIIGLGNGQVSGDSTMVVADAPYTVSASAVSATEGQALSNVVVGTITDSNLLGTSNDFTASIQWGDGATTAGTVVQTGAGAYNVQGSHTYLHAGSDSVNVIVTSDGGTSETGTATATVANATLTATAVNVSTKEGTTFTGKVAHFTDANSSASAADFTALIGWGDGTTTSGTVVANNSGGFDVTGSHAWSVSGNKVMSVVISGAGGGTTTASPTATVTAVAPKLAGTTVRGVRGTSLTATIATVIDANTLAAAGNFTATIAWGDGTTSNGTVTLTSAGHFNIVGTHTYSTSAVYSAKITLYGVNGTREVASSTLTITKPSASGIHTVGGSNPEGSAHQRHLRHVLHVEHMEHVEAVGKKR